MSKIHILREDTISKIAAGEVVERPSAIIKELFENAVDAGSTEITVEIESGGKDLIRVIDNGSGIAEEDMDLLFERHATSKIDHIGDLYTLKTMGFRGEALHSIAAVSKVVLITRQGKEDNGIRMEVMGGEIRERSAHSSRTGTTIEVTDLFYNTPVRWKFMKTTTQETRSCIEIMNKLAIANAGISVTFQADGRLVFKTDGRGELLSAVFQVFGRNIAEELMKLDFQNEHIKISGLSSKFSLRKKNRNYILTFVNGRYVKSQELNRIIEGCYRSHLMGGEFPVSLVFVEIDPAEIDVNVHPAKTEIKFADVSSVSAALTSAIKTAINRHTHVPVAFKDRYEAHRQEARDEFSHGPTSYSALEPPAGFASEPSGNLSSAASSTFSSPIIFPAHISTEKADGERRDCEIAHGSQSLISEDMSKVEVSPCFATRSYDSQVQTSSEVHHCAEPDRNAYSSDQYLQKEIEESRNLFLEARIIGVYDRTFILMEYRSELYLIDQHAAHEKILFEEYTASVASNQVARQYLLLPFEMDIDKGYELPDMEPLGFEIELFGIGGVIVRAIPAGMTEPFARDFLRSVFDESWHGSNPFDLATRACKAAIKGGDDVFDYDIDALTKRLFSLEDPFNCPHGRPVMVKFTRREIDKLFKRVL